MDSSSSNTNKIVARHPVRPTRTTVHQMAPTAQSSLPTASGSLNRAADAQKVTELTTNVVEQITAGKIIDFHQIAGWRTQQDEPGFERDPATSWLATVGHLVLCMEPELSRPTVLLYISTRQEKRYALTLTNEFRLVQFKMQDITNRTNLVAPNKGHLKCSGAFYPSSRTRGLKPTSVPHLFPLAVKDVAHLLATNRFPNKLQKQGTVPTLTTDTCHWLRFAATQSTTSTTCSRRALLGKLPSAAQARLPPLPAPARPGALLRPHLAARGHGGTCPPPCPCPRPCLA